MKKINKIMSIDKINKELNGNWVIIDRPTRNGSSTVKGLVLYAGRNKKEVMIKIKELKLQDFAFLRAGGSIERNIFI